MCDLFFAKVSGGVLVLEEPPIVNVENALEMGLWLLEVRMWLWV